MKGDKHFSMADRLKSFKYAINGIRVFITQEHNARIHVLAAIVAVVLGFMCNLCSLEWIVVLIAIAMVFIAEIFNTAIERLCDFVHPECNQAIKEIKDLSAGAVLVSAALAITIGIILLLV